MAEPSNPPGAEPSHAGIAGEFRRLLSAFFGYFEARLKLAGIESREALVHYLKLAAWLAAACVALLFGYVFLVLGLILLLHHFLGWPVVWVTLGVAGAHFVVVAIGLFAGRALLRIPQFQASLGEFRKDREWLRK